MPKALRALSHRDFRLFWSCQIVSLIGTWMQTIGQSWMVLQLTDSAFKLGLISTLQFAPVLLFSLFAGVWIDRLPKRRFLIATQITLMLLALCLSALVWTGWIQYWHVAILATCLGVVQTLDTPLRQSFVFEMVGKEDLVNAVALNSAAFNVARSVGPAVAGIVVAWKGPAPAFLLNGISFLAVIIALMAMRTHGLPRPRRESSVRQEVRDGLRFAVQTPPVLLALGTMLMVSLFVMNYNVTVPLLARQSLHLEAKGFGMLMSALGAGSLAGTAVIAFMGTKRPSVAWMILPAVLISVACMLMAGVRRFELALVLLAFIGVAQIVTSILVNSTVQLNAPDELRGRLMSLYALAFHGFTPVGALISGSVAQFYGVSASFLVGGAAALAGVVSLTAWWRHSTARGTASNLHSAS